MIMCDVVVVGAGPGGAVAAYVLARRGLSVCLVEQHGCGRDKPCAGGLSAATLKTLACVGIKGIRGWPCHGTRTIWRGRKSEAAWHEPVGLIVERAEFDRRLAEEAEKAGAHILWRTRAKAVVRETDRLVVETEGRRFDCRAVVLADGACGALSGRLATPPRERSRMVFVAVASLPAAREHVLKRCGYLLEVDFDVPFCGYGWLFPRVGGFNLGAGGLWRGPETSLLLREYVERVAENLGYREVPLRYWWIPECRIRRALVGGVFLVGDAAGLSDHFTGEGIRFAVESGVVAAESIAEGLEDCRVLGARHSRRYEARIRHLFEPRLRWAQILGYLVYSRGVFKPFVLDKGAFRSFLRVVAGERGYGWFVRWLFVRWLFFGFPIWLEKAGKRV